MLICGVFLIELIHGLTSIPLNCDYRNVRIHVRFFFLGAPDAQSGIDDAANQWHSAPMRGSMSHLPPPFPLRWERRK